jgi:hypothetical protein
VPETLPQIATSRSFENGELGKRTNADIETDDEPTGSFEPRPEEGTRVTVAAKLPLTAEVGLFWKWFEV